MHNTGSRHLFQTLRSGFAALLLLASASMSGALAKDFSDEEVEEIADFIIGNTLYTLYHEVGHMLIESFDLAVLGREEDAVDNLATILLLEADSEFADQAIIDSADGWFMSDALDAEVDEPLAYYGEHGLDQQRGYQIVCLAYGSDPEIFSDIADDYDLPDDRRETCARDYDDIDASWSATLNDMGAESRDNGFTGRLGLAIKSSEDWPEMRDLVVASDIANEVVSGINKRVSLPEPAELLFQDCDGDPNAYWDPEVRKIIVCYDLLVEFGDLIAVDIEAR